MMSYDNKQTSEQDFKDKVFKTLSERNPDAKIDKNGYLVIPVKRRKKDNPNTPK